MRTFLELAKALFLFLFALGSLFSIAAILNFLFQFTEIAWLDIRFLRLYLFVAVVGILGYILIRFRRRPGE